VWTYAASLSVTVLLPLAAHPTRVILPGSETTVFLVVSGGDGHGSGLSNAKPSLDEAVSDVADSASEGDEDERSDDVVIDMTVVRDRLEHREPHDEQRNEDLEEGRKALALLAWRGAASASGRWHARS
jgi:hypothetical protein